jgi:uncharacterized membrane protein
VPPLLEPGAALTSLHAQVALRWSPLVTPRWVDVTGRVRIEWGDDMHTTQPQSRPQHPIVVAHRAADLQLRIVDGITAFAGSMPFVYLHAALFGIWMLLIEPDPWPMLTLIVSLEAIFLQQAKADHDFNEQELELKVSRDTRT